MKLKFKRFRNGLLAIFLSLVLFSSSVLVKPVEVKAAPFAAWGAWEVLEAILLSVGITVSAAGIGWAADELSDVTKDDLVRGVTDTMEKARLGLGAAILNIVNKVTPGTEEVVIPEDTFAELKEWVKGSPSVNVPYSDGTLSGSIELHSFLKSYGNDYTNAGTDDFINSLGGNFTIFKTSNQVILVLSDFENTGYAFAGRDKANEDIFYYGLCNSIDLINYLKSQPSWITSTNYPSTGLRSFYNFFSSTPFEAFIFNRTNFFRLSFYSNFKNLSVYGVDWNYSRNAFETGEVDLLVSDGYILADYVEDYTSAFSDVLVGGGYDVLTKGRTVIDADTDEDGNTKKKIAGDVVIGLGELGLIRDAIADVQGGLRDISSVLPLIGVTPIDLDKEQSLVDGKSIDEVLEDIKNPAIPGTDVDVVPTGLFGWLEAILNAILSLPGAIAQAIASFFVPDPDDFNNALNDIKFALLDFGGAAFDMSFLFDEESPLPDIKVNFYGKEVTIVSMSLVNGAIEFFRPVIRGFITLLLIFYNYNQLAGLIGQQGVSIAGLVMRDEQLAAKSKKGKDD